MPSVASTSVQPHPHAHGARGHAHAGHEPSQPFAELLDGTSDVDGSPPQANNSGPKDPTAQRTDAGEPRDGKACKSAKDDKCAAKDGNKAEKSEGNEPDKAKCPPADDDCAKVATPDGGVADAGPATVDDLPKGDESATDAAADKADASTGALAPIPPPAPPVTPPATIAPAAIMPADIVAAIDNAEPVEVMPAVQPLGAAPAKPPVDPAQFARAAMPAPVDQTDAAEQAPEALPRPKDALAKDIEVDKQPPHPQPERAPALKAANADAAHPEDSAERGQNPPAEKAPPEQRPAPAHAAGEQPGKPDKQDKASDHNGHPAGAPATQPNDLPEARPQDASNHLTGQVHASSLANVHALEAPASERGVAQGIPAPAVLVPIAGLAIEFAARLQAGRNRFEIRLDPPELGRVDVRLDVDREGNVSSRLVVERQETLDLLRRDASQLERALQQAGLKTADNSLQFSLRDQSSARQHDDNPNRARVIVPDPDLTPADTGRIYGRMLGLGGGVDIRV